MLEELVEAVAARKSVHQREPPNIILRTANTYRDRIHEYVMIPLFHHPKVRTVQGIYYSSSRVHIDDFQLCKGYQKIYPFACSDNWTNFQRMCSTEKVDCTGSGRLLWNHISARLNTLKKTYTDMQLDMVFLEGHEDIGHPHLSFQGRQYYDIAVITRIRDCVTKNNSCFTVAIDDYRYEAASLTSDAIGWYPVVASLRITGQVYAWLHVFMLFFGCYNACLNKADKHKSRYMAGRAALQTMLTCPSQLVIYGSVSPVACYAVAHLLDCNMMYEIVAQHFVTVLDVFHLDIREFVKMATVSTRSVWILALSLHAVLFLRTKCCWASSTEGIPGIPEFSISAIASLTICAQFRAIVLRNTKLEDITEVVIGSRLRNIRSSRYRNSHGFWYLFFMGNNIDFKCLIASGTLIMVSSILLWAFIWVLTTMKLMPEFYFTMWPHTLVSYAADSLWSPNLMMVSWNGFVVTPPHDETNRPTRRALVHPTSDKNRDKQKRKSVLTITSSAFVLSDSIRSYQLSKEMILLENRSREVMTIIFLMNLTVMTEPIVFYNLRWFKGHAISIYRRFHNPQNVFMLPVSTASSPHIMHIDWTELEIMYTMDSACT